MDSQFNPDTFIDLEVQGALDTQLIPIPVGEWMGQIGEVKNIRQFADKKDPNVTYYFLDIPIKILDQSVIDACQRPEPSVRHSISLDIANGALDMGKGKNVGLGALREALDMNRPDQSFSIRMLQGRAVKVKIKHTRDKDDPTKTYVNVDKISAPGL